MESSEYDLILQAKKELSDHQTQFEPLENLIKEIAIADLRAARLQKKISQKELSEMTGLTQSQISNLEKEPTRVSVKTLQKLAKALGIKIFI